MIKPLILASQAIEKEVPIGPSYSGDPTVSLAFLPSEPPMTGEPSCTYTLV